LGLTISKNLVELMGGQLCVSSQINHGTQFWFELALPILDYNLAQVTQQPKILVVDDNDDNSISQTIVFPPLKEIKNIYDLTLMGNVNKLNKRIAILSNLLLPKYKPS
jgi:chemotaxis protein histidine kinase CheA